MRVLTKLFTKYKFSSFVLLWISRGERNLSTGITSISSVIFLSHVLLSKLSGKNLLFSITLSVLNQLRFVLLLTFFFVYLMFYLFLFKPQKKKKKWDSFFDNQLVSNQFEKLRMRVEYALLLQTRVYDYIFGLKFLSLGSGKNKASMLGTRLLSILFLGHWWQEYSFWGLISFWMYFF